VNIETQKKRILEGSLTEQTQAVERLVTRGDEEAIQVLIDLLESADPQIRNSVALGIYDLKPQRALEPLLAAIFKDENHNFNGTLVYALGQLDCGHKLKEIFTILFYESYEAKYGAYEILDTQIFEFSRGDLLAIKAMWEDLLERPERCPGFDSDDTREMILSSVNGYMSYLDTDEKAANKGL
jgi:HEAT repeat protein